MNTRISLLVAALFCGTSHALPSDFAGLKLGQNVEATLKFMTANGHNVIHPDGKITQSEKPAPNQLCTVTIEPLSPKANRPAIQTFNCGVVKGKDPNNSDRVIDTFIVHHFLHEKSDDKAYYLTFMFNLKTIKPAGSGLVGKLGEPDTITPGQACPAFIKDALKLRRRSAEEGCFVAVWLPDGSDVMASAVGFGKNLVSGKLGRLELWNMQLQKKVEEHKATKAAHELGF